MRSFLAIVMVTVVHRSKAQLHYQDAAERSCISQVDLLPKLFHGVNIVPFLKPTSFYMPMAAESTYLAYAESLLGRPPQNLTELNKMAINLQCGTLYATVNNIGFPTYGSPSWLQTCVVTGLPDIPALLPPGLAVEADYFQGTCNTASLNPVPSGSIETQDSLVWGDNDAGVFLITRCLILDNIQDWKVISYSKTIDPAHIAIVTEKIQGLGFSADNIRYLPYN